jgi:hypothetical protein
MACGWPKTIRALGAKSLEIGPAVRTEPDRSDVQLIDRPFPAHLQHPEIISFISACQPIRKIDPEKNTSAS